MEGIIYILDICVSNIVTSLIFFHYMFQLYRPRYESKKVYFSVFVILVISYILINLINVPIVNCIYGFVSLLVISHLLFQTTQKATLVYSVMLMGFLVIIDIITTLLFTILHQQTIIILLNDSAIMLYSDILNQIIVVCTYRFFLNMVSKHQLDSISWQQNIFLLLLATFEIILFTYIVSIVRSVSHGIMLTIIILGFLFMDIYILYLFEIISRHNIMARELSLKKQQSTMMSEYYHNIERKYEQSRLIIHDMKNHMQIIETLYHMSDNDVGKKYANEIYKKMDELGQRFKCQNQILNILINDKIEIADSKKIAISINMQEIDLNFISEIDITTIFGNLFDNAIEACASLDEEKRKIELRVHEFNCNMVISLVNSCNQVSLKSGDNYVSTKKGHYGIGLRNVETAIGKYEGNMKINSMSEEFGVLIIIPIR